MTINSVNVALIIPTLNRHEFILRTLKYYSYNKSNHPIYIGDASKKSIVNDIELISQESNCNVYYYHWPNMSGNLTLHNLAEKAYLNNETYCAYQGDDDLFVPDSLSKCALFLSNNKDFESAQGRGALISLSNTNEKNLYIGNYWRENNLTGESYYSRLNEITNSYWVIQFSVHRMNNFYETSKKFNKITDNSWGEIYHCLALAMKGKSKYIECLYLIRIVHDKIIKDDILSWMLSKKFIENYDIVCNEIYNLSKDDEIKISSIKNLVNILIEKTLEVIFQNKKIH